MKRVRPVLFLSLMGSSGAATSMGVEGLVLLGPLRVKNQTKCKEQDSLETGVQFRL